MAAGEGGDRAGEVVPVLHGQGSHVQARGPTLGAGRQRPHLLVREGQAHHPGKKSHGLILGEAQIGVAQLDHLPAGAQAGQPERRIETGGDDQVHLQRQVLQQEEQDIVDSLGLDQVIVVEHEDDPLRQGRDLVDQGRQDDLGWDRLG